MGQPRLPMVLVLTLASAFAIADVYKWVDENGKVHYGDRPPGAGTDSSTMTLPSAPPRDADHGRRSRDQQRLLDAFEAERAAQARASAESAAARREGQEQCEKASHALARFERANIIYSANDNGERDYMSDEERRKATTEITLWIAEHCP